MWLLSTARAELQFFSAPETVTGGYAILSHTWSDCEQSFEEIQATNQQCKTTGENPRDLASAKIRECCILAERHGYQWAWVDTCCIDKTSSTELSEAINSMFLWYACAEVCFAYLEDVPSDCVLEAPDSAFRTARWHKRGWTLQELIAPALVIFVAQDWTIIGNKLQLAQLLQQVTGVWWQVLTRETHLSVVSVGQRMNWASSRSTTRVEDEAYCLMGLFNVNMPTIYGEGRQAFQRLQHEIMKQSFDTSLFAWGRSLNSDTLNPLAGHEIYKFFNTSSKNHVYLLAHSPSSFTKPFGRTIRYVPSATYPIQPYLEWQWKKDPNEPEDSPRRRYGPFGHVELPKFSVTSYGLECRFPIIESDGLTVAVLLCDTGREHVGLLLHPSNWLFQDPTRKKYHSGNGFRLASGNVAFARLISLGNDLYNLRLNGKTVTAEWRDIFIADSPPPTKRDVPMNLCYPLHSLLPAPPFRIPHWLIGRVTLLGMELRPLYVRSKPVDGKPLVVVTTFEDVNAKEGFRLILGTCGEPSDSAVRWAKATPQYSATWGLDSDVTHDCQEHHLEAWPGWTKDFGDIERTIRLSFSRCKLSPHHTVVVHIELEGRVYNAIKDRTNVRFPSREEAGLVRTGVVVSD
ncbi:HET-domain-containing protein [Dichomitus squalens LYAD-421 SS1]|uniref:HET-domain-containing protein n=1 Tax=Dichomitus squalens (strain LYAD-421) TaxID=732165 RepID=R7SXU9_DICSQ|nr:HET-domain-containing protein [Dichomitus squalens LYAD-421 SS1]EJF60763.1 HET-domain-containing protein [Dichomitus squalens LYAD-421 SS1]